MLIAEWQHVLHTKGLLKIILGILLVPTFYAVIFLASLWNPYSNVKNLPVGIVNNDTTIVKQHTRTALGHQLTRQLLADRAADFRQMSAKHASQALKTGKLYMAITIPKNFSARASKLGTPATKPIYFNYHTNAGFSFIAMKMNSTTAEKVQTAINTQLVTAYLQTMAKTLGKSGHQFITAGGDLTKTTAGLQQVASGAGQLTAANTQLSRGTVPLQAGLTQLDAGLAKSDQTLAQVPQNDSKLQALLAGFTKNAATNTGNETQLTQTATAENRTLSQDLQTQQPNWRQIKATALNLTQTLSALHQTQTTGAQLTSAITAAQKLVSANTVIANQVLTGASQERAGSQTITAGLSQLSQGAAKLATNTASLAKNTTTIKQTDTKLATGILAGGQQLADLNPPTSKALKNSVTPVRLTHTDTTHVQNNGTGMTPYLMSVALFVGCITFNIIYDMFTPHKKPKSAFDWWGQKLPFFLTFTLAAASVMYSLLLLINHLTPLEPVKTWAFCVLTIWAFGSIVTFFNLILGKTGAWLMLIFMIVQLGGSAGTYPIQLSNHFFQVIHPYLPMSISIEAFRSTLSIENSIWPETLIFIGIIVGFNLLMLMTFARNLSKVTSPYQP